MNRPDSLEQAIRQLKLTTRRATDERILADAFVALARSVSVCSGQSPVRIISLRRLFVQVAAVAAVVVVASMWWLSRPKDTPIDLYQIYRALQQVENVYVSSFYAGDEEPGRQLWASRPLSVQLYSTARQGTRRLALLDLANRLRKTKHLGTGFVEVAPLSEQTLLQARHNLTGTFGLLPFADINDLPPTAQWRRVDDPQVAALPDTAVFDLIWQHTDANDQPQFRKWRVYVDLRTKLPKRCEWYSKNHPGDHFHFQSLAVIDYPSRTEVLAMVQSEFGSGSSDPFRTGPGYPEYMGTPGSDRQILAP